MNFEEELNKLVAESGSATTPEEHLAILRKLQKLFEDNRKHAYDHGVETSASYYDNPAYCIMENAENGGINVYTATNYYEWLPSSWDRC